MLESQGQDEFEHEEARSSFREAGREIKWAAQHYHRARAAIQSGYGSPHDLKRSHQAWRLCLMEWVQACIRYVEASGRVDLSTYLNERNELSSFAPLAATQELAEVRQSLVDSYRDYTRIRHREDVPSDKKAKAWRAWGENLVLWSRLLSDRAYSDDNRLIGKMDDNDLVGAVMSSEQPADQESGLTSEARRVIEISNRRERERNRVVRAGELPKGKPLPLGRDPRSIMSINVDERTYRLIVNGHISIVAEAGHRDVRRLRAGSYVGICYGREIHYCKVQRVTAYASPDALVKTEVARLLDPERTALQILGEITRRLASFCTRYPHLDVRGVLAIELAG